jgi:hypothetical protein
MAYLSRNEKVEAPLYEVENIQHDNLIPFSGPGGRRFKSSLPDHCFQAHKRHFWFFRHSGVDDFVDGRAFLHLLLAIPRALQSGLLARFPFDFVRRRFGWKKSKIVVGDAKLMILEYVMQARTCGFSVSGKTALSSVSATNLCGPRLFLLGRDGLK